MLESSCSFPEQAWEAQIWHNLDSSASAWTALSLHKRDSQIAPLLAISSDTYKYTRHVFTGELALPPSGGTAQFTVRFRTSPDAAWQWANQQRQVADGELVYGPRRSKFDAAMLLQYSVWTSSAREELQTYIDNLSADVGVERCKSDTPSAILWSVTGTVNSATAGQSGTRNLALGTPSAFFRYFALVRVWSPWLAPRHGKTKLSLTEDAVLCSFLRRDGTHLVLLAVSGTNNVLTVFQSGDSGEVVVSATNDNLEAAPFQLLASVAEGFEIALAAVIYEARKLVRRYDAAADRTVGSPQEFDPGSSPGPLQTLQAEDDIVIVENDLKTQWLSEWFDGLTYCTWNALGQDLTQEKILNALEDWKSHGIEIVNLIIDDNWQSLDSSEVGGSQFKRRWLQFEANPVAFPKGLKDLVQSIRRSQPSIEHIAVWHALMGYWGGISPNGELAKKYKTKKVVLEDPVAGGTILAIDPDDILRFFDDFYAYLTSTGIDSVKTDAQFYLDLLKNPADRRKFIDTYQDAWSISSLKHFSTRSISCMSMVPQLIFHSQLPTNKPTILLRNSDDFFPDIPSSHPWHIFCNAHNALLTRYLNVLPDWDMFQTSHPYASFHAAARCVSGGPIYVTDKPGMHDLDTINQMTAPTIQKKTVILRPSVVGRTLDIYHHYNEGHVLRVGTYTGWAKTGSGIMGLFNMCAGEATVLVPLLDFPGISEESTGQYIVRAHTSRIITGLMRPLSPDSLVSVCLADKGWEILTAYPIHSFNIKRGHGQVHKQGADDSPPEEEDPVTHVAVLGLIDKMTGAAAVVNSDIFLLDNGRLRADISLKALGTLGIYFSDLPSRSIANSFMVMISGRAIPRETVWKEGDDADARILAIDVLAAWNAMGLKPGWSNEVSVQVFLG